MSRRGWIVIGIYIVILLIAGWFIFGKKLIPEKKIHYHAGFVVFKDNKKLNFSDNKYMNIRPCTSSEDEAEMEEDEQLEKAHLHDNVGDVVHVEKENSRWGDLFTNIHYPIDYSKTTAFVDGQKVDDFKNQQIYNYESIVIFIGDVDKSKLKEAVKKDHIVEEENKSESCGK